jgi:hypothetical protein
MCFLDLDSYKFVHGNLVVAPYINLKAYMSIADNSIKILFNNVEKNNLQKYHDEYKWKRKEYSCFVACQAESIGTLLVRIG